MPTFQITPRGKDKFEKTKFEIMNIECKQLEGQQSGMKVTKNLKFRTKINKMKK